MRIYRRRIYHLRTGSVTEAHGKIWADQVQSLRKHGIENSWDLHVATESQCNHHFRKLLGGNSAPRMAPSEITSDHLHSRHVLC